MHAANPTTAVRLPDPLVGGEAPYLVLGGDPPSLPGANLTGDLGRPFSAIILLDRIDPAELTLALETAPDPAVPIADFGNNNLLRHDFGGASFSSESLHDIAHVFAPIWRRLAEIPNLGEQGERDELTILRLAYSRDTKIKAVLTPETPHLVEYPLLGAATAPRPRLEMLAGIGLLHPTHFMRTHACRTCDSSRLNVYEACPACGSSDLREESLVHHYRCGCQEVESHFTQGSFLICPKCHRALRHLGVDYGKPGKAVVCANCGATESQPFIQFVCLDCASITSAESASEIDWYHYDLTSDGILALRQGRLPHFDIAPLLAAHTRTYSPHEFQLLASYGVMISKRYKRPFSIARITVLNLDTLLHAYGALATDDEFRQVANAVVADLRTCDFVGVDSKLSCMIGLPETTAKRAEKVVDRIRRTVKTNVNCNVELGVEIAEGDAVIEMLGKS